MKKHIPNAITCGNLLCGCFAIVALFEAKLTLAAYLVLMATLLDFLDGLAARLLNAASPIGKDLDSLADVITFGVVPSLILMKLIEQTQLADYKYLAFSIAIFSALRLAKFNNDTRQTNQFIGLPTPANAIFIVSLVLIQAFQPTHPLTLYILNPYTLIALSLLMPYLLVAEIPLMAFKFKTTDWKNNQQKYIFLTLSLLLLVGLQFMAVPFIILMYVSMSLFQKNHSLTPKI